MNSTPRIIPPARLALAIAAALLAGTASRAAAQQATSPRAVTVKEEQPGLAAQATIPAESATARAKAAVPKGRIQAAEIEEENGRLVYSYDIKVPGRSGIDEVQIDAKTGALVSKTHESPAAERREAAADRRANAAKHAGDTTRRP